MRLRPGLGDGSYTATYRVISADGHPVSSGFVFAVGDAAPGGKSVDQLLAGQSTGPITDTAFSLVRAVQYAAIALGLGTLVFLLWSWLPALRLVAGRRSRVGGRVGRVRAAAAAPARDRR